MSLWLLLLSISHHALWRSKQPAFKTKFVDFL